MMDGSLQSVPELFQSSTIKQGDSSVSQSISKSVVKQPKNNRYLQLRYFQGCGNSFTYFRILFIKMCNQEYVKINKNPTQEALNCIYLQELVRMEMIKKLPDSDENKDFLLKQASYYVNEFKQLAKIQDDQQFQNLEECFKHYRSEAMNFISNYSLQVVGASQRDENQDFFYFCFQVCLNIRKIFGDEQIFEEIFEQKSQNTTPNMLAQQIDSCDSSKYFRHGEKVRLCFEQKDY